MKVHCQACAEAVARPLSGSLAEDCIVCRARHISTRPACAEAVRTGVITAAYRAELQAAAGPETEWMVVHELVRAWRRGECPPHPKEPR